MRYPVADTHTQSLLAEEILRQLKAEVASVISTSIITLVQLIVLYAQTMRASDVHIIPRATNLQLRLRVDGLMVDMETIPLTLHTEIIARIKVLASLRSDEHYAAQDGRFEMMLESGNRLDVRVSLVPVYYGENCVLRLLAREPTLATLEQLGFSKQHVAMILSALAKPYGLILATGPTGSGKTTTLYTLIGLLQRVETSIITIEDPIEYAMAGINQIQVNNRTGLTFASGLRSMLRQDPDTMMVGEIRDPETAALAVNAALTGHVVLSTLHTNDAATTLPRLLEMKVEPYLLASTVSLAIGQRLVRRLCEHCRIKKPLSEAQWQSVVSSFGPEVNQPFLVGTSVGCTACQATGYLGRIGIYEVLPISPTVREAILEQRSARQMRKLATLEGMTTLLEDGLAKVVAGETTLEEIMKMYYE